jgi:hypothetical protein
LRGGWALLTALHSPRALFIATPASSSGPRLNEIDATDGSFLQVEFKDHDGHPVTVTVGQLEALSSEWVWLYIWFYVREEGSDQQTLAARSVLLRISDGKLFDLSNAGLWPPMQIHAGSLYTDNNSPGILQRVDLSSLLVVPMSNPAVDGTAGGLAVDADGNVRASEWIGGSWGHKIFFADNSPPAVDPWGAGEWGANFCSTGGYAGSLANVYGEDGNLYSVCIDDVPDPEGSTTTRFLEYFARTVRFTDAGPAFVDAEPVRSVTCTGPYAGAITCPETRLALQGSYNLNARNRKLLLTSGFFTMTPVTGGGISLAWTDLPLPAFTALSGSYGYWQSGDSVERLPLEAGATPEVMVATPNLISWQVVGGSVVFTKYLTGTAIGTYRVDSPGMDPELVSSSDMQVQQIVELEL